MPDCFALLNEPRRPWVEPQQIQSRFIALSAGVHPDRVHDARPEEKAKANQRFAELNAAFQCLRSSKHRARHLLELERGARPDQLEYLTASETDQFFHIGQLCKSVDQFLQDKATANSPLLRVRFFEQAMVWRDQLEEVQTALNAALAELECELMKLNDAWAVAPPIGTPERAGALPLDRLEQLYRRLSYHARWLSQVQDRILQLSL